MHKIYCLCCGLVALLLGGCITPSAFLSRCNDQLTATEQRLKCQEKCSNFSKIVVVTRQNYAQLQHRVEKLQGDNSFLYRTVEEQNQIIARQQTVVSLQETVIRLFDDSNHSTQKNIAEQITAQQSIQHQERQHGKWTFTNTSLFEEGTTVLSSAGQEKLKKVAAALGQKDTALIRVAGHADDRALKKTAQCANNWELSTLRAAAVVQFFQSVCGLPPEQLSATGYGYYQPLVSNENAAGRQQNSRIEISVAEPES